MRKIVPILAMFLLLSGCGKKVSEARTEDEFVANLAKTPELEEIDTDLDSLEANTRHLEETYSGIQTTVLTHADFKSDYVDNTERISVFINDNSVLIVNNKIMSRNDFTLYADKHLPMLCTPTPRLSIHKKANYDTAAWVLEQIYAHGCSNVDVE